MRFVILLLVFLFTSCWGIAQPFAHKIIAHREHYKNEFLKDEKSPLSQKDLKYLRFYKPDSNYKVMSTFISISDTIGFDMQTHNGVLKKYYVYGKVSFQLKGQSFLLYIYQSAKLKTKEGFEDYLFIPFTDETNYEETFGGGRYLDFKIEDIQHDQLEIDFNKCYNPYCAFKEGYACPIPPSENKMAIPVKAGEKLFGKPVKTNIH